MLAGVVARRSDPALTYVDGLDLYGAEDERRMPLPDRLHPDGPTHDLIGTRFAPHLERAVPIRVA